jgi:hypothetical protein
LLKVERDGPRLVFPPLRTDEAAFGHRRLELRSGLFAIPDRVIRAEWNLFSAGQQELLAALHQVLLIEGPWVHEILEHDHDHVLRDVADYKAFGNSAGLTGEGELVCRFLRPRDRRRRPEAFERALDFVAPIWHDAIRDVVQVIVYVHDSRKWRDLIAVDERIRYGIARGKAARDRDKVGDLESFRGGCGRGREYAVADARGGAGEGSRGVTWASLQRGTQFYSVIRYPTGSFRRRNPAQSAKVRNVLRTAPSLGEGLGEQLKKLLGVRAH